MPISESADQQERCFMDLNWRFMHRMFGGMLRLPVRWQLRFVSLMLGILFTSVMFLLLYRDALRTAVVLAGVFWGLFLLFCIFTCFISSEGIVRPIASIKHLASMMSVGDLSARASDNGCREMIELSGEMNRALNGLKTFISKINEQADILKNASTSLAGGSLKNNETANIVIESMQELSDGASQQANSLSDIAESVHSLSSLIRKVSDRAAQLSASSSSLKDSATAGEEISAGIDDQLSLIFESTERISREVSELTAKLENVAEITTEISDIAEQTNLLALNASIEAARAGDHGLGFNVVASETSKLSQRSMSAAKQISDLTNTMIVRSRNVSAAMEQGVTQAQKGKALSGDALNKFRGIFSELGENIASIKEIADSAKTISQSSEKLSETVSSIASFSEQILASTEQVLAASHDQSTYTSSISELAKELADTAGVLKQSITIYLSFSFFGSKSREEITRKALNRYSEINPYIKFRVADVSKDGKVFLPLLRDHLAKGTAPDIIQTNQPWLPELKEQGDFFIDLRKETGIDLSGFEKNSLDMCSIDGNLMGLPTGLNAICLIVNNTFFSESGVSPDAISGWESIIEIGSKIASRDANRKTLFAYQEFAFNLLKMFVRQKTGGQFINDDYTPGFTSENLSSAFSFFKRAYDSGAFATADEASDTASGGTGTIGKTTGLYCCWVSDFERHRKGIFAGCDISIMMPPVHADAKTSAIIMKPQLMMSVNSHSENVREAVKFLNWIYYDPEGIKAWGTSRGPSPTAKGAEIQKQEKMVNPFVAEALANAVKAGGSHENPLSMHGEIAALFSGMMRKTLEGKVSPESAAGETMRKLHRLLSKIRKRKYKRKKIFVIF
jgi:methyl-accepting chemotaxis protein/ABC-type glycerol-3-phosphate transport system substrate-binding protein